MKLQNCLTSSEKCLYRFSVVEACFLFQELTAGTSHGEGPTVKALGNFLGEVEAMELSLGECAEGRRMAQGQTVGGIRGEAAARPSGC
jgi:hypothetical protein